MNKGNTTVARAHRGTEEYWAVDPWGYRLHVQAQYPPACHPFANSTIHCTLVVHAITITGKSKWAAFLTIW